MNLGDFYHVTNVGAGAPKVSFKFFWNDKIKSYWILEQFLSLEINFK